MVDRIRMTKTEHGYETMDGRFVVTNQKSTIDRKPYYFLTDTKAKELLPEEFAHCDTLKDVREMIEDILEDEKQILEIKKDETRKSEKD